MRRFIAAGVLVLLAACETLPQAGPMPRGFSQPGSPFPYNSTGW
jgi:hypothetical protein